MFCRIASNDETAEETTDDSSSWAFWVWSTSVFMVFRVLLIPSVKEHLKRLFETYIKLNRQNWTAVKQHAWVDSTGWGVTWVAPPPPSILKRMKKYWNKKNPNHFHKKLWKMFYPFFKSRFFLFTITCARYLQTNQLSRQA